MAKLIIDGYNIAAQVDKLGGMGLALDPIETTFFDRAGAYITATRGGHQTYRLGGRLFANDLSSLLTTVKGWSHRFRPGNDHIYTVEVESMILHAKLISLTWTHDDDTRYLVRFEMTFYGEQGYAYSTDATLTTLASNTPAPIYVTANQKTYPTFVHGIDTGYTYISSPTRPVIVVVASTKIAPSVYSAGTIATPTDYFWTPPRCIRYDSKAGEGSQCGLEWQGTWDWSGAGAYGCLWFAINAPAGNTYHAVISDGANTASIDITNRLISNQWCLVPVMIREFSLVKAVTLSAVTRVRILATPSAPSTFAFYVDGDILVRASAYVQKTTTRATFFDTWKRKAYQYSYAVESYAGFAVAGDLCLQPGANVICSTHATNAWMYWRDTL